MNRKREITAAVKYRRHTHTLAAMALLLLIVALPAGQTAGQQAERTLKEQLVGTWLLVSNYNERPDGSKFEPLARKLHHKCKKVAKSFG